MNALIQLDQPATIKAYFEKVRELAKGGAYYPVNLDNVWPLVYSHKHKAVKALKDNFVENEDYEVLLTHLVEQKSKRGGHNEVNYHLTVACLEYFVAKKSKPIFDVYRQVFHKALDQAEQKQVTPVSSGDLLLQTAKQLLALAEEHHNRISSLEENVEYLLAREVKKQTLPLALPLPEQSLRSKVLELVNVYCREANQNPQVVWNKIYERLYYLYRVKIRGYSRKAHQSLLDVAEQHGHIEKIYAIVSSELHYNEYVN